MEAIHIIGNLFVYCYYDLYILVFLTSEIIRALIMLIVVSDSWKAENETANHIL